MYCLFCLLVSGRVAPKNPFSSRHEARAGSLAANAPEPHNHVFVENGEYFSAFGHVANEGPISYHVPTDTWVEGAPGFPVLQQGHANGCGFALAMLP